jgi:biotin operon repressor
MEASKPSRFSSNLNAPAINNRDKAITDLGYRLISKIFAFCLRCFNRSNKLKTLLTNLVVLIELLSTKTKEQKMPNFPTIHSDRAFGVEIECFGITIDRACQVIQSAGIDVSFEGYNHQNRTWWKIVTDSSVPNGFEVVSPILSGNQGLDDVRKVAQALRAAGAKVDKRCGFHVHVDARTLTGADILNVIRRYAMHEAEIDSFMPASRRGNNNRYCRTMTDVVRGVQNVAQSTSARTIAERVYERYYKLNVAAFVRHGTIEFRQHSGTIDFRKMANWICFCVQFIEDSRTLTISQASFSTRRGSRIRAIEQKFRKLAELLENTNRYNPARTELIAQTLEIEESTVPSYISQFRSRYSSVQISARRGYGYYKDCNHSLVEVVNSETPTTSSVPVEQPADQGIFAFLAPEVVSYFRERAIDLAS